jgi:UDP-N-acetylglucosamine 4,6-dehydratase
LFKDKRVLVTGCGSLGRQIISQLLEVGVSHVTILDNSEQSFFKFREDRILPDNLRFILADIADQDAVARACHRIDYIIHTIAKKFVNYIEDNPIGAIKTNVTGTINIINACCNSHVLKVLNISTDKACHPASTYGLTKALTERLTSWANIYCAPPFFSTIRFPNFLPSDGSCFSIWEKQKAKGEPITITDRRMTRYFIPIKEAATLTLKALELAKGGEIFVPAFLKEQKITDVAATYGTNFKIVGRRPGEKLHESLMTSVERKKAEKIFDFWRFYP